MVFKRRTAALGLVLIAAIGVGGCGSTSSNSTPAANQTPSQPITSPAVPATSAPSKAPTTAAAAKPKTRPKPTPKALPTLRAPQPSTRITPPKSPTPVPPPRVLAGTITINNYSFAAPSYVSPGARITVFNKDNVAHSVTSDQGSFFNVIVQPGHSATFTAPRSLGHYAFHCIYHGNMHGTLTVR